MTAAIGKNSIAKLIIPSLILGSFFEAFLVFLTVCFPDAGRILLWHTAIICYHPPAKCATPVDLFCFLFGLILGVPIYGVLAYLILKLEKRVELQK